MKIKVTTVYENVDEEWLGWYLKQIDGKVPLDVEKIRSGESLGFTTKDPSSQVSATTSYQLER